MNPEKQMALVEAPPHSLVKAGANVAAPASTPKEKNWKWLLDPAWLWEAFLRRRHWIGGGALALASAGCLWGAMTAQYTANLKLVREGEPNSPLAPADAQEMTISSKASTLPTLVQLMASTELLERVACLPGAGQTVEYLKTHTQVQVIPDTELVNVRIKAADPQLAKQLADAYGREALRYLEELQAKEASECERFFSDKLTALDEALSQANTQLAECMRQTGYLDLEKGVASRLQEHEQCSGKLENLRMQIATMDLQITNLLRIIGQHHPALLSAKQALQQAALRYTEEHPKVQELRANLATIELRIAEQSAQGDPEIALNGSSLAQGLYAKVIDLRTQKITLGKQIEELEALQQGLEQRLARISSKQLAYVQTKSKCESLRQVRQQLVKAQEQKQFLDKGRLGGYRPLEPARVEEPNALHKWRAGACWGVSAGLLGLLSAGLLAALVEVSDRRIRSARELARVTRLPILAVLDDLEQMTEAGQQAWAFQTFTLLHGQLAGHSRQAVVCGFISSGSGEGRSTWVRLLAQAASQRGYRVLTLGCHQGPEPSRADAGAPAEGEGDTSVMLVPQDLARTALLPELPARIEIPLTDWAWNLERRSQWQQALNQIKDMQDVIVFVELPPASLPEAFLLSENVAPLIWLCGKDMAEAGTTCRQLEALQSARAQVAGAVFNRGARRWKQRAQAVLAAMGLGALLLGASAWAQPAIPQPATPALPPAVTQPEISAAGPLSVTAPPSQMADWQKRLTLGAGDVLQLSLYGQADTTRSPITIGPDGRINYLQARDVVAAGLTVDELRDALEKALLKFYRPPLRVAVIPQAYRSKKYYVLGNVMQNGVFVLDRPVTLVEAIATAGGFVNAMQRRTSLNLADLSRSFLIRKEADGKFTRKEVNFEALFQQGDLRQNIQLAPEDYLYFPPQDLPEVYVLGEVMRPGVVGYAPGMSAMKAIAQSGGFAPKAYRQKLLIVRGSLNRPVTYSFDASDVLRGTSLDFKLEPRDIVYVPKRPWAFAEEILEAAIADFARAVVVAWTGRHVGPIIEEPIFRQTDL